MLADSSAPQGTCGWDWLCRLCRCLKARAAHPSQHTLHMASETSLSGFLLSLLYLYCPRLGQRTFPEMEPKPLCAAYCLHSLPELDLHKHHCSVSTSRSSGWRWESFVPKVVQNRAKALHTWPKILLPCPVSCTTPMQERAKFKLKCLCQEELLSGLGRQTAYASACEMWLSLCYLALSGYVCY